MSKSPKSASVVKRQGRNDENLTPLVLSYYVIILVLALGAILPGYRLWAGSPLAFTPPAFTISWLLLAAVFPIGLKWWTSREDSGDSEVNSQAGANWKIASIGLLIIFMVSFFLLRGSSFLLGDGQQMIANLAKDNSLSRPREIGAEVLVQWLNTIVGSKSRQGAILTYQVISWICGAIYLIVAWLITRIPQIRARDRFFFLLSLLLAGHVLLFFGYVENYAPLAVAVGVFCLAGIQISEGKINRWLIVLPLGIAILFHIVGAVFVVPALYLLLRPTAVGKRVRRLSPFAKGIWLGASVLVAIIFLVVWSRFDLFVRFALVPLMTDRFTVSAYTLFSGAHLADIVNLLVVLCPAIFIYAVSFSRLPRRTLAHSAVLQFLALAVLVSVSAVFILDPKLGMARDWDLLSFPAIPLTILGGFLLLNSTHSKGSSSMALVLACALGVFVLVPRVWAQHDTSAGAAYAEQCMKLDLEKNRTSLHGLEWYYRDLGDTTEEHRIRQFRADNFPQDRLLDQSQALLMKMEFMKARSVLEAAEHYNPSNSEYWIMLSFYFLGTRQYDSALYVSRIADGLNPYNPTAITHMGSSCLGLGDIVKARAYYEKAVSIDSTVSLTMEHLAYLYRAIGERGLYEATIVRAGCLPSAKTTAIREACRVLVTKRDFAKVGTLLTALIRSGEDSVFVDSLVSIYPEIHLR